MSARYPYNLMPLRPSCKEIRLLQLDDTEISTGSPLICSFHVSTLKIHKNGARQPESIGELGDSSCGSKSPDDALAYSAVSYTWGNNPETAPMVINGHLVQVPANTEIALRGLLTQILRTTHREKHATEPTSGDQRLPLLWIDALCIDQENLTEKSQQVAMMGEIYSRADEVLVWLGDDGDGLGPELEALLNDIYADCARATDDFTNLHDILFPKSDQGMSRGMRDAAARHFWSGPLTEHIIDRSDFTTSKVDILTAFFSLPWFSRVWIIQEILLAKRARLYWGEVSIPWPVASLAAQWLLYGVNGIAAVGDPNFNKAVTRVMDAVLHASTLYVMGADVLRMLFDSLGALEHNLATLLNWSSLFNTTEPRDNIYALLGLLYPRDREELQQEFPALRPDYSLDLVTVYTQATRAVILTTGSIYNLKTAGLHQASLPDCPSLPSWVPRYGRRAPAAHGNSVPISDTAAMEMLAPIPEQIALPPHSRLLRIKAHILHTVADVGPAIHAFFHAQDLDDAARKEFFMHYLARLLETWRFARNACGLPKSRTHTLLEKAKTLFCGARPSNPIATAHAKTTTHSIALTLISGLTADGEPAHDAPDFLSQISPLMKALETYRPGTPTIPPEVIPFLLAVGRHSANRHFFITAEGSFGMGPPGIRRGDRTAFLFGHAWPFVVRQEKEGHWVLMGDVYWDGFMDGLHFRRLREEGVLERMVRWIDIY
ncbi:hypothetical protein M409DRAFT_24053 [Zasmidium cellare ATCC 36951]|uniref:Heterokaryon incompatibility domain-containing protein n=1 Tax=Zasmidium cellare ATCC 36951 TaxID=1080233 RepID=A0A6A6CEX0_ZASCE|nr:uncharacterized protein M409DRAFT_24053 [Zasmidium cellare ATCC 36951]KAF2165767.1 hypothetical protein M409DRAFT_24053 [Zasmidium cellare ATCC 36951]